MASGGKEHRMVFDIRGRRRHVVKAVYAVLAILMGTSLFLVVGPVNLGELFNQNTSTSEASKQYEEQIARIEAKLRKDPNEPNLLLALTRSQVNAGNSLTGPAQANGQPGMTLGALRQYQEASQSWDEYLKATKEPSAGMAQLMSQTLFTLANFSRSFAETKANLEGAAQAQKIVADQRPNLNSVSTLALYTYYTFDYAGAERIGEEAKKLAPSKIKREELENQFERVSKQAHELEKQAKEAEKAEREKAQNATGKSGGNPESLEAPSNPLSEAFGGGSLTE